MKNLKKLIHFKLLILFFLISCNETAPLKIYTYPEWNQDSNSSNELNVSLFITGKIKGKVAPETITYHPPKIKDGKLFDHQLQIGGLDILKKYIDISRKRYGENFLLIDSGSFLGPMEQIENNEAVLNLIGEFKYDFLALNLDDLLKLKNFQRTSIDFKKIHFPLVNSNFTLFNKKEFPLFSLISEYKVFKKGNTKIAITSVDLSPHPNVLNDHPKFGVYLEDPIVSLLKIKQSIKKSEINFFILVVQIETSCLSKSFEPNKKIADFRKFQLKCNEKDPLTSLINRLPPNTIDLVVATGNNVGQGFIDSTPVIITGKEDTIVSKIDLYFDKQSGQTNFDKISLTPPLKLCHQFFQSTQDCIVFDEKENYSLYKGRKNLIEESLTQLIPAQYLGISL